MSAIQLTTDRDYKAWRGKNTVGFIANMTKTRLASYYVIHNIKCTLIKPGSARSNAPGAFTERGYLKTVGPTVESVIDWGHREGFPFTSMRPCQGCLKGAKLPLPTVASLSRPFDPARMPKDFTKGSEYASREETLALREKATKGHHELLVNLHKTLTTSDWTDLDEIPTAIDLWARSPRSRKRVIFEAKTLGSQVDQTRSGLAQLLEYRHVHGAPGDDLCLVVDGPLREKRNEILAASDISVLWHDGHRFQASGNASRSWLTTLINKH
ncbi:hypothetical protein [Corallococcus sp. AB038B]|uniref:hypothetical protein n=1 Tax=Corallococcus sp. AB038B TaxID=2316718 RepID=UPI0011C4A100|nr:hypothetical protein [Corallococcus sp. AB038B]